MKRLSASEVDAILAQRRASAQAAMKGRSHRALPLDVAERLAREKRVAWADTQTAATLANRFPHCSGACEQGRSLCNCPTAGASAVSGIEDEPPYNTRPKRYKPTPFHPTYTVAAIMALAIVCAIQWVRS